MAKVKRTKKRVFKPGELKRLLGIPEPMDRAENGPKYCRSIAALVERKLRAGDYDGKMGGLLRRKAVYYVSWYRWRARNERKEAA